MKTIRFNLNDPPSRIIEIIREDLLTMRETTKKPKLFEWQLGLYDFILSQPDPDAKARQYMDASKASQSLKNDMPLRASHVAKEVGYPVPFPTEEK